MTAEYTVPALREQATNLRRRAEDIIAGAQVEADKLWQAAADLDAIADERGGRPPETAQKAAACWNCSQPIVHDGLSWRHAPGADELRCQVPGPNEYEAAVPADETATDLPAEQAPAAESEAS